MTFLRRFGFLALSVAALGFAGCQKSSVINIPPPPPPHLYESDLGTNSVNGYPLPLSPATTASVTLSTPFGANQPTGLATDASGRLYVSVQALGEVLVFNTPITATSTPVLTIGPITPPAGAQATWVTFDGAGNLWVSDQSKAELYEFTPPFGSAAPNFTITTSVPAFAVPQVISFDQAGELIVPQYGNASVYVYRPPFTAVSSTVGVIATCALPVQSKMNSADWLFISCDSDGTLRVFTPPFATGSVQAFAIAPPLAGGVAEGMVFDSSGNLYVEYDTINVIAVFAPPFFGGSTPLFTFPSGTFPFGLALAP